MARVKKVQSKSDALTKAQRRALLLIAGSVTEELNLAQQVYHHIHRLTLGKLVKLELATFVQSRSAWKLTAKGKEEANELE